jgi:hypothetical protein
VPFCCNEKTQRNETALKNFSHFIQNDQVKLVHLENGQLGVQAQKNFKVYLINYEFLCLFLKK